MKILRLCFLFLPLVGLVLPTSSLLYGQTATYTGSQPALNFGNVNVCPAGATTPAPCSKTLTLTYHVDDGGTFTTPQVLTQGSTGLDFTLASGSTCIGVLPGGPNCTVKVKFTPRFAGARPGAVQLMNSDGSVVATTLIYGTGLGPQVAFDQGALTPVSFPDLSNPQGIVMDGGGNIFVLDTGNNRLLKSAAGGGTPTTIVSELSRASVLAMDGAGDLYIADTGNNRVLKATADGSGQIEVGTNWSSPSGVSVDVEGNVFIVDSGTNRVLKLPAGGGAETTVYEIPVGTTDGGSCSDVGESCTYLEGVIVDPAGNLFVIDYGTSVGDLDFSYGWTVTEVPVGGGAPTVLYSDGGYSGENFSSSGGPFGLALDGTGNLFISDPSSNSEEDGSSDYSNKIVEIPAGGGAAAQVVIYSLTTVCGNDPNPCQYLGSFDIAVNAAGDLFLSRSISNDVVKLARSQPQMFTFASSTVGTPSVDSPQTFIVTNAGNEPLTVSKLTIQGSSFKRVPGPGTPADCANSSFTLEVATGCSFNISFTPKASGALTGKFTATDDSLNAPGSVQAISLIGTGIALDPEISVNPSVAEFGEVAYGRTVSYEINLTNTGNIPLTLKYSINGPSYTIEAQSGPYVCGAVLAVGNSCYLIVQYSPATAGAHIDYLTISAKEGASAVVKLRGTTGGAAPSVHGLEFGTIPYGGHKVLSLTITNQNVGRVWFSTQMSGPSYKVLTTGDTCIGGVSPGQSCTIPVEFDPISVGEHPDVLTVTVSSGTPIKVGLCGTASAPE